VPMFRTSDGVQLNYLREGAGRLVVLIAGYCAPATSWALTQDALVDAGYEVVAWDRRSHGASESPVFGQRMSRHGKDLQELLTHLENPAVTLVGGSMGASTIWAYLDDFGTGGITGIVTLDQTPKMLNTNDWSLGFYGYVPENAGTYFAEGVPDTGRGQRIEQSMSGVRELATRLGGMPVMRNPTAPETIHLLQDHANQDWRDVISRIDIPFLMVSARESQLWPCEHAESAVQGNPMGRAAIIDDVGHAMNFERPDLVNEVLLSYLAEH
jgi:non-heme chloroperoxidase